MKGILMLLAICAMALPGHAGANTKTVVCDGCGETEYSQLAIQAAGFNDLVLVVNGQDRELRKYAVTTIEDFDGGSLQTTAFRISPTQQEVDRFAHSAEVIDAMESGFESCGPGHIGDWVIPDLWFDWACNRHDLCYEEGGDDDDRLECDRDFYWDLRAFGATHGLAAVYFVALRASGWMFFSYRRGGWSSSNPLFGCNFLIVCDYTSMVPTPG